MTEVLLRGIWWGLMRAIALLPLGGVRFLGRSLGWVLYVVARERRRVVEVNLRLCFPLTDEQTRAREVRAVFDAFAKAFVDRAWLWHGSERMLRQRLRVIDPTAHLSRGLGGYVVFWPHFVGLEAGWTWLNQFAAGQYVTIYAPQKNRVLDHWIRQGRLRRKAHLPSPLLFGHRAGMRPVVKALRSGATLCVLPDMNYDPAHSFFPTFFGIPAATLPILSRYARLGGKGAQTPCPVIGVYVKMTPQGYDIFFTPVWPDFPGSDDVVDAQRLNNELERIILSDKEFFLQYYWVHKRFKDQPAEAATRNFY